MIVGGWRAARRRLLGSLTGALIVPAMAGLLLTPSSPADAQRATVLLFDPPFLASERATELLAADRAGLKTTANTDDIEHKSDAESLIRHFHMLGSRPNPEQPKVALPLAARPLGPGRRAVCVALPYRPRGDLPLATEARRARLFPLIAQAACEEGVPTGLFDALVAQESRYRTAAISSKGAMGLTQLMPGTARYLAVANPYDALANLRGGARYLGEQLRGFSRVDLALAAYNAGPARVRRYRAVPPFAETRHYVATITRDWLAATARQDWLRGASEVIDSSDRPSLLHAASLAMPARVTILAFDPR